MLAMQPAEALPNTEQRKWLGQKCELLAEEDGIKVRMVSMIWENLNHQLKHPHSISHCLRSKSPKVFSINTISSSIT